MKTGERRDIGFTGSEAGCIACASSSQTGAASSQVRGNFEPVATLGSRRLLWNRRHEQEFCTRGALRRPSDRGIEVQTGIIKWINRRKGFVLIGPDSGRTDVLLHVTAIEGATRGELKVGQKVQFETIAKTETLSARNFSTVVPLRHS